MKRNSVEKPAKAQKKKSFRWGKLILVAFAVLAVIQFAGKIDRYQMLQDEIEICEQELAVVQEIYDEKAEVMSLLQNDAYIERLARENLGMVKQGETVVSAIQVPGMPVAEEGVTTAAEETVPAEGTVPQQ